MCRVVQHGAHTGIEIPDAGIGGHAKAPRLVLQVLVLEHMSMGASYAHAFNAATHTSRHKSPCLHRKPSVWF